MKVPRVRLTVRRMTMALAGVALVFGGTAWGVRGLENHVVVENRSGQPVAWIKLGMANAGPVASFTDLPDGGSITASFHIRGDDSFTLDAMFADGTKASGSFGYVTNGEYGRHPRFVLAKDGRIEFTD
jgi:hypothetical protein